MIHIIAKDFLFAWNEFEQELRKAEQADQTQSLKPSERDALAKSLCDLHYQLRLFGLEASLTACKSLLDQILDPAWHRDRSARAARRQGQPIPSAPKEPPLPIFATIYPQLRHLNQQIWDEMDFVRLVPIHQAQAEFFDRDDLLGQPFHTNASVEINREIKAAGNCIALGLYTASVLHSMRAAEAGMRALATHLQMRFSHPVEYEEWHVLIGNMQTRLGQQRTHVNQNTPRGPGKDEELDFYNGLLDSLNYFKDAYRNPVAHFRGHFEGDKATLVFNDVKRFMLRLAKKVPLK